MYPRDNAKRQRFAVAAAQLRAVGTPVTARALSELLQINYYNVRSFLRRDPTLTASLGVIYNKYNSLEKYVAARDELIRRKVRPTHRRIAELIGIHPAAVSNFLRFHTLPEAVSIAKLFETLQGRGKVTISHFKPSLVRTMPNIGILPIVPEEVTHEPILNSPTPVPVHKEAPEPRWVSELKRGGEVTVERLDTRLVRVVLDKVSPKTYVLLWNKKQLGFQFRKQPKPDHMPSPEEISKFL